MIVAISNQKGGVGKTTTTANLGVLLALDGRRVLLVDADPQFALTRQLGIEERSLGVNLVDVLAGRAGAEDAIVTGVHGVDVIASGRDLAGIELSLVGEIGREWFLRDARNSPAPRPPDATATDPPADAMDPSLRRRPRTPMAAPPTHHPGTRAHRARTAPGRGRPEASQRRARSSVRRGLGERSHDLSGNRAAARSSAPSDC